MSSSVSFGKDDFFLLGNIAARSVIEGLGEHSVTVLKFIQHECPDNAGAFMLQAVYMYSIGAVEEAADFLEEAKVFDARLNGAETFAFYLVLLKDLKQNSRIHTEVRKYLAKHRDLSEPARHAIEKVVSEVRSNSGGSLSAATN